MKASVLNYKTFDNTHTTSRESSRLNAILLSLKQRGELTFKSPYMEVLSAPTLIKDKILQFYTNASTVKSKDNKSLNQFTKFVDGFECYTIKNILNRNSHKFKHKQISFKSCIKAYSNTTSSNLQYMKWGFPKDEIDNDIVITPFESSGITESALAVKSLACIIFTIKYIWIDNDTTPNKSNCGLALVINKIRVKQAVDYQFSSSDDDSHFYDILVTEQAPHTPSSLSFNSASVPIHNNANNKKLIKVGNELVMNEATDKAPNNQEAINTALGNTNLANTAPADVNLANPIPVNNPELTNSKLANLLFDDHLNIDLSFTNPNPNPKAKDDDDDIDQRCYVTETEPNTHLYNEL